MPWHLTGLCLFEFRLLITQKMEFGGNSQKSLHKVEGVRKVNFPFSSIFPTWSSGCFPQVEELFSAAFQHGPGCMADSDHSEAGGKLPTEY